MTGAEKLCGKRKRLLEYCLGNKSSKRKGGIEGEEQMLSYDERE